MAGLAALGALLWLAVAVAGWFAQPVRATGEERVVRIARATLYDLDRGTQQALSDLPARRLLVPRGYRRFKLEADFETLRRMPHRCGRCITASSATVRGSASMA